MSERKRTRSLRLHLALWLLLPLLGLLALDAWLTYKRARDAANTAFDRMLFTSARAIAEGVSAHEGKTDVDIPYFALEMFETNAEGRVFYRVSEENGRPLTGYPDLPLPRFTSKHDFKPVYTDIEYRGETLRMVILRLAVRDLYTMRDSIVWVQVAETPESRRELAKGILLGALRQEALLVLLVLIIVRVALGRGLRPLRRLSERVAAREEDDLTPLEAGELQSELKPLVDALNLYIARIQRMLAARRRFFADAAHQLKTPLAVMQAQAELALREPEIGAVHDGVRQILGTLHQTSHGVQQLLSHSRLEPDSGLVAELKPVDLVALARDAALEWAPVARRNGIDLGFEQEGEVTVEGQPGLLLEMIGNLIDNAIRYAAAGANDKLRHVTVRVEAGPAPRLVVIDNGPGIPAAERGKVFLRFYRVAGTQADGTGLGLPIVREIARLHNADVELDDTPGGGLTVSVVFPAAEDKRSIAGA
ncbi:sensor histidine kinase [Crenobacter cavernae]|uniref:histidine kinase n=1 Tax=Crenobacter cavernae TaxID=2290923 RepID=A0A345Y4Y8_9NEIS|nr:sensor histidine kinase [Crenobacter cavernae]AXK38990.1 sensor histidine kinase [Crenobacter cavernae]